MNIPQGEQQRDSFLGTIIYGFKNIVGVLILIFVVVGVAFKGYIYPLLKAQIDAIGVSEASAGVPFIWFVVKFVPFAVIFGIILFLIYYMFIKETGGEFY